MIQALFKIRFINKLNQKTMRSYLMSKKMYWLLTACTVVMMYFSSCKPEKYPITTNNTLNAIQYFENNPDFSLFDQALVSTGYAGFLGAYGGYTIFAPNNQAVTAYLHSISKTSVDQVDPQALKNFVSMHIIQDTLSTSTFTDGKLPTPTMYGQYITTGAVNINGASSYTVNKQAHILQPNIRVGNGIIHTIDNFLSPATQTIAQIIAANPKYSIFSQALSATGYYDTLNVAPAAGSKRPFLTLIAQTDSVFNAAGITSFSDLKNKYSTTGNPKNPNDSLNLFVAYRIIPSLQFLGDIIGSPSQSTLAPQENINVNLISGQVLLNQVTFNGILEPGVQLDRTLGDVSASNGVIQSVKTNFKYKVRVPTALYYDVCDQPELKKLTSVFRRTGQSATIAAGQVARWSWEAISSYAGPQYVCDGTAGTKNLPVYNDYLFFALRQGNTAVPSWFEVVTPLIVKGTYKVWICHRQVSGTSAQGAYTQVSVDGQPLARIISFLNGMSSTSSAAVLESQGFKRYLADPPPTYTTFQAQLAGVVTINTTDVHRVRLTCIKNSGSGTNTSYWDMVQFIPIDQSQTAYCITTNGQVVPKPSTFP
jgi:uncharacterized surface protein with fasciclin (FAS1) repeats